MKYFFGFGHGDQEEWAEVDAETPEAAAIAVAKGYTEYTGDYKEISEKPKRVYIYEVKNGTPKIFDVSAVMKMTYKAKMV